MSTHTKEKETRIFVVDDVASIRAVLRMVLSHEGYNVVGEFANGSALIGAIEKLRPHIICLDFHLPDIDGISLLKQIHAAYPEIAVVMVTGSDKLDLEHEAAEEGSAGFIHKPFTHDKVARDIMQVVHAQQLLSDPPLLGGNHHEKVRARAVIADDSDSLRELLAHILPLAGVQVVGKACDGKQAVEMVDEFKPDIVCLDINMPVMDGLRALKIIHSKYPAIKAMIVTVEASRTIATEAAKAGAKGYILKPYRINKVVEAVDRLVRM